MDVAERSRRRFRPTGIAFAVAVTLPIASAPAHAAPRRAPVLAAATVALSADSKAAAETVVASGDARGRPFVVVDKRSAVVSAFDASGRWIASAPALLGLARGDASVPGIGERAMADIRVDERTTPAGRFDAEMGVNLGGEDILWVDYDNAVSLHRVRTANPADRRLARLHTPDIGDNRISYGCINVPAAFFDSVVKPLFAANNGVVYVLPETRPWRTLFEPAVARGTPAAAR